MPKRKISAKELAADIRGGMDAAELATKHDITERQLQSTIEKLVAAGILTAQEGARFKQPAPVSASQGVDWKCPACGKPAGPGWTECPHCGVIMSKWQKKSFPPRDGIVAKSRNENRPAQMQLRPTWGWIGIVIICGATISLIIGGDYLPGLLGIAMGAMLVINAFGKASKQELTIKKSDVKMQETLPKPKLAERIKQEKEIESSSRAYEGPSIIFSIMAAGLGLLFLLGLMHWTRFLLLIVSLAVGDAIAGAIGRGITRNKS